MELIFFFFSKILKYPKFESLNEIARRIPGRNLVVRKNSVEENAQTFRFNFRRVVRDKESGRFIST